MRLHAEYVYVAKGRNLMALNFKTLTLKSANGDKLSPHEYEIDNYYTDKTADGKPAHESDHTSQRWGNWFNDNGKDPIL